MTVENQENQTKSLSKEDLIDKKIESEKEKFRSIPSGKVKSGRVWKEKKNKFANLMIQKSHRSSWQKKMDDKAKKSEVKKLEIQLKEEKKQKKIDLVKRQKLNEERRKENEKKAEIVQKVKNSAKLKRIKKKLLRKV